MSGAPALAAAGVSTQLIQLLGRWTSVAIQRYTQNAALVVVPDITKYVLADEPCAATDPLQVMSTGVVATNSGTGASSSAAPATPAAGVNP